MLKISLCIELFFSTETPPKNVRNKITKNPFLVKETFFCQQILKKMSLQGQTSFSQKNTVHRRRGVWRILMNYIQPNAGQTTHSIYTLIQDGAQYVPLKCRKARREFYWTKKKTGGDWGILMFLGASRVLFCCCCESQMGYLKKRKAMGVVHFACIIMFNVKHPLFNVHLQLFTRF